MPLTIRTAEARDIEDLAPLFDAYRSFFTKGQDLAVSRAFLIERIMRNESVVLAAFEETVCAGFLQLYPLFSSWYCKRQWFLSDLYVEPRFRGRGVGKRLVRACLDFAGKTAARAVLVELPLSEPHLVRFYEQLGFAKDGVFDLYRAALA
ncbi:MAG: GNAT family N-acetyltransferase [Candidatus Eremiobacteraeota bacterium]|nr:GNAT family N-acetyltransferase [Candidatus Eremiobacteraeota bacterium]